MPTPEPLREEPAASADTSSFPRHGRRLRLLSDTGRSTLVLPLPAHALGVIDAEVGDQVTLLAGLWSTARDGFRAELSLFDRELQPTAHVWLEVALRDGGLDAVLDFLKKERLNVASFALGRRRDGHGVDLRMALVLPDDGIYSRDNPLRDSTLSVFAPTAPRTPPTESCAALHAGLVVACGGYLLMTGSETPLPAFDLRMTPVPRLVGKLGMHERVVVHAPRRAGGGAEVELSCGVVDVLRRALGKDCHWLYWLRPEPHVVRCEFASSRESEHLLDLVASGADRFGMLNDTAKIVRAAGGELIDATAWQWGSRTAFAMIVKDAVRHGPLTPGALTERRAQFTTRVERAIEKSKQMTRLAREFDLRWHSMPPTEEV